MERLADRRQRGRRFVGRLAVALGGQLEIELRLFEGLLLLAPVVERAAQRGALAQRLLRRLAVVPEIRGRGYRVELLNPRFTLGDVKDTSRTRPGARRVRCCDPSVR
jgi:hypothetical protein